MPLYQVKRLKRGLTGDRWILVGQADAHRADKAVRMILGDGEFKGIDVCRVISAGDKMRPNGVQEVLPNQRFSIITIRRFGVVA